MADGADVNSPTAAWASPRWPWPAGASAWTIVATLSIGVMAVAVRLWCLHRGAWFDEWASIYFSSQPVGRLWSTWMIGETNPPLYYTLLKAWCAAFGPDVEVARLLSLLAGLCSIAVIARCSWLVAGRRAAFIAALLLALSSHHVFYSTNLRAYIFALLAFSISLLGVLRMAEVGASARSRWRGAILYAAGATGAIYFHTTMLLWPAAASLVLAFLAGRDLREWRYLTLANVAIAAASSWWLMITYLQLAGGTPTVAWIQPVGPLYLVSLFRQSIFLVQSNTGIFKLASYAIVALVLVSLLVPPQAEKPAPSDPRPAGVDRLPALLADSIARNPALLIAALLGAAICVFTLANMIVPIALSRTMFWMSGMSAVLVASGISRIRLARFRLPLLAGLACLLFADLGKARDGFIVEDWPGAIRAVPAGGAIFLSDRNTAVVAQQVCRNMGPDCRVHFFVVETKAPGPSWGQNYQGMIVKLPRGAKVPLEGQAYLIDSISGEAGKNFDLPDEVPMRKFGWLKLLGPVEASRMSAR